MVYVSCFSNLLTEQRAKMSLFSHLVLDVLQLPKKQADAKIIESSTYNHK